MEYPSFMKKETLHPDPLVNEVAKRALAIWENKRVKSAGRKSSPRPPRHRRVWDEVAEERPRG